MLEVLIDYKIIFRNKNLKKMSMTEDAISIEDGNHA
jgi:hypothetical protein